MIRLGRRQRRRAEVCLAIRSGSAVGYYDSPHFVPGLNMPILDLPNLDPHLWVHDKSSGEMLSEIALPSNATGAPTTYMAGGKQYIAFPVGGGAIVEGLIAVSL